MAPALLRLGRQKSRIDLDADKERSREIDRLLRIDKKKLDKEIKVLLLGAADSGKSTIIKQMRILNHGGFRDEEKKVWKNIIFRNLVDAFLHLFSLMDSQDTELQNPDNIRYLPLLQQKREIGRDESLPPEYFDYFKDLWDDDGLQLTILKAVESILSDNLFYFIEDLGRLFKADYMPSNQDILYAKSKTIGIVETAFELDGYTYRLVDVGGQRSERKKWIRAFDGVAAVIFVASISGYDQCILEDSAQSQTEEALVLFKEISNLSVFKRAALVLFLNKIDLLHWKLQNGVSPVRRYYTDYTADPTDVHACHAYFADKFKRLYRDTEKKLYIHFTTATDTNLLNVAMESVRRMILQHNISSVIL